MQVCFSYFAAEPTKVGPEGRHRRFEGGKAADQFVAEVIAMVAGYREGGWHLLFAQIVTAAIVPQSLNHLMIGMCDLGWVL
jgi:hypothetical protein